MAVELPKLPYALDALEPHISKLTLEFHHGKHHKAYVDKTNELIANTDLAKKSLEEIVRAAAGQKDKATLFNNAAQAWNHTFLWNSMSPKGGKPTGALAQAIEKDLGGFATFAENFKKAAVGQFGSGWAWLTLANGKLEISATGNADTPLVHGKTPLLTLDVWEHAYYLDYQNRRPDYVSTFLEKIVNWDFAAGNLQKASQRKAAE
ncbi:MAG TPA: superoxide dismutase [Verrucomicrobiae bacterium]|jgi:superoxide dismutase, Fe-Mn family|nr:superoxide dismutase [Verrucomicrobiae bacterium]